MHIDIDPYAVYKVNWLDPGHQQSVIWITEMYRRLFLLDQETDWHVNFCYLNAERNSNDKSTGKKYRNINLLFALFELV